jgi:hypothetical protein
MTDPQFTSIDNNDSILREVFDFMIKDVSNVVMHY